MTTGSLGRQVLTPTDQGKEAQRVALFQQVVQGGMLFVQRDDAHFAQLREHQSL